MHEDQDYFTMPKGVFVTPHIVHSNDSWPAPASQYAAPLRALAQGACLADDESRTQAAIHSAVQCSAEIRERLRVEAIHPYFGPENKRSVLGKIVGRAMQELDPDVETNANKKYKFGPKSGFSDIRTEDLEDSLPEIPEGLVNDEVVAEERKKFEEAKNKYALARVWKNKKYKSSSEAAKPSGVSVSIEFLGDRYYSPTVYTPLQIPDWLNVAWPDRSMCEQIRQDYLLPTLLHLPIERINSGRVQGSYRPLQLLERRLVFGPVEHYYYNREFNFGHREFETLKRFVMENTIENAMRKLDDRVLDLTQLSEGAETILLRATPAIIAASNDANRHLRKYNESEIKQQWQRILRAVVSACPNVEGRHLDAIAERVAPLSRNELADRIGSNTLKEAVEVHSHYLNPPILAQLEGDRRLIALSKDNGDDLADLDDADDEAHDGITDNRAVTEDESSPHDGDELDLASRLKRSLAADQDRSLTAVHELYTRMRELQGLYEKQTPDEIALKARLLRYFARGSTFDGCLVWSFRGYFSDKYSPDEIKSYRFFNFDDAKQAKDPGQVAEPSKSTSHAADCDEAAATSPVVSTRTQELLGEAREVCAILTADKGGDSPSPATDLVAADAVSDEWEVDPEGAARELASPAIFFEYKSDSKDIAACFNQARFDLIDALKHLDSRGIHNFPVFAVVVVDTVGHVITAWSEKGTNVHKIMDTNCPQFDIAEPSQALRYATFLVQVCTLWTEKFDALERRTQEKLDEWWKPKSRGWRWKMDHQKSEKYFQNAESDLRRQFEAGVPALQEIKQHLLERINEAAEH
ncbi:hypothetical protein K523DRAFT_353306 [Schizophyllum commune Tattone D]|nr:hypothetical protein K523DRAFT_353306 [Schizophyllum commune Tattone D]